MEVMEREKKHFVLVHGACHGAWCWYKLATLLESSGHKVTALDLGASGVNLKQVHQLPSFADYCGPLLTFVASLPLEEKVVLVGHSLGGLGLSMVMERFPNKVAVAVFVTAFMPGPEFPFEVIRAEHDRRFTAYTDSVFIFDEGPDKPPTALTLGPIDLSRCLYQCSPPEDLKLATMLMRPLRLYRNEEIREELKVTKEKYGLVPRVYVVCEHDKVLTEDLQRWMIQNNPADDVKVIDSDHMPMFSKPLKLYSILQEISSKTL